MSFLPTGPLPAPPARRSGNAPKGAAAAPAKIPEQAAAPADVSDLFSSGAATSIPPAMAVMEADFTRHVNREQAEAQLVGKPPGAFLLRNKVSALVVPEL